MDSKDNQIAREFVLRNKYGLHARTAALFVKAASVFASSISVYKGDVCANGKSIMDLMILGAGPGSTLKVVIEGGDAGLAVKAIEELFDKTFLEIN